MEERLLNRKEQYKNISEWKAAHTQRALLLLNSKTKRREVQLEALRNAFLDSGSAMSSQPTPNTSSEGKYYRHFRKKLIGDILIGDITEDDISLQRAKSWHPRTTSQLIACQVQLPDVWIETPKGLLDEWYFVVRPEGIHVLVFISRGKAVVRNKCGICLLQFELSSFDGDTIFDGVLVEVKDEDAPRDCFLNADASPAQSIKIIFVLDTLLLNGIELADTSYDTRRFFLTSKFSEAFKQGTTSIPLVYLQSCPFEESLIRDVSCVYSEILMSSGQDPSCQNALSLNSEELTLPELIFTSMVQQETFCDSRSVPLFSKSIGPNGHELIRFIPDGIIATHKLSPYIPGWTPLCLHLRTADTSRWANPSSVPLSATLVWESEKLFRAADGLILEAHNVEVLALQKNKPASHPALVKIEFETPTWSNEGGKIEAQCAKVVKVLQPHFSRDAPHWRTYADSSNKLISAAGFTDLLMDKITCLSDLLSLLIR